MQAGLRLDRWESHFTFISERMHLCHKSKVLCFEIIKMTAHSRWLFFCCNYILLLGLDCNFLFEPFYTGSILTLTLTLFELMVTTQLYNNVTVHKLEVNCLRKY